MGKQQHGVMEQPSARKFGQGCRGFETQCGSFSLDDYVVRRSRHAQKKRQPDESFRSDQADFNWPFIPGQSNDREDPSLREIDVLNFRFRLINCFAERERNSFQLGAQTLVFRDGQTRE